MKKKSILLFAVVLLVSLIALVACDFEPTTPTPQDNVTVSFNVNYDNGTNPQPQTVVKGAMIYLPSASRSEYLFDGWYTDATQGTLIGKAGDAYVVNADATLYAHWMEEPAEEPDTPIDPFLELLKKIQAEHPQQTYTNENYTLTRLYAVNTQDLGAIIVCAKWTVVSSTGVTVIESANRTTISIPSERNTDLSYTLKVTLTDASGVAFTNADDEVYSAEFSHIAQRNMATVHFSSNYNGGANPTSQTVLVGATIKLPDASRSGYTFAGWYTAALNGDCVGEVGDDYVVTRDVTLYAYWEEEDNRTIVFYSTQPNSLSQITQQAIASFEAKYPGWTIKHVSVGNYDDVLSQIINDLQAGAQPDLAYCYPEHVAQYLTTQKTVDLSQYINSTQIVNGNRVGFTQEELDDFIAIFWNEGRMSNFSGDLAQYGYGDDALFCLPFVKSTEVLFYNATALAQLGIDKPAATWEELWQHCQLAKEKWGNCTPLGYDSEANWFITAATQNAFGYTSVDPANHYLFNNDGAVNWLNQLKEKYRDKLFTTQQISGSYVSNLLKLGPENGGAIYCIGSTGGASNYNSVDFTVSVAPIPGVDATHNQCISQGPSLTQFTTEYANASEREIMTFLFVKELFDVEVQAVFSESSGYMPIRKSVYDVAFYKDFLESNSIIAQTLSVCRELTDRFFTSPVFVGATTAREQVGNVVKYVITGQKTADMALRDAYKNCGGN